MTIYLDDEELDAAIAAAEAHLRALKRERANRRRSRTALAHPERHRRTFSDAQRAKMSEERKGKPRSLATRVAISVAKIQSWQRSKGKPSPT